MSTKTVRNIREPLKKPRPLRSTSIEQPKDIKVVLNPKATVDVLSELENLNVQISNYDLDESVLGDMSQMCSLLKKHGEDLESSHKDALDRYFCTLRNSCREDRLDVLSRLKLLEIIEMRAMGWKLNENMCSYFNTRYMQLEESTENQNLSGSVSPSILLGVQNQNSLAPGEFLKSSGKFSKPTKIAGKNYFKDEIVIRNCDSGKVMGIKGRRVHMIEELSDTVISFQRVNVGARDRLVQITGPHEEAISHAKFLVEDTIKRNVSPVRDTLNMPELSLDNKEHVDYGNSYFDRTNTSAISKRNLMHSYSMGDASSKEFSIPIQIGQDIIKLSGMKSDLLNTAKNVLIEYFSGVDTLQKDSLFLPLSKSASSGNNNQRYLLKKQTSLKDNLPSSLSPADHTFSRHSSSSSSSSDEIFLDKESSDQEVAISSEEVPIPPPSYPRRHTYTREFLLECSQLPLSQKLPRDYEQFTSIFPTLKPQSLIMFDPSSYLENNNSQ